ncbi:acyl carrier protein [Lentzea flaviverrucosa]|uniref:acyl carrier protein n=1 Tax=Lentzea flaviverrucosa TaxID=200379 RepID=UPI000B7ED734|nr:phosphopantetheine-binding protein [Lentzea flaviverrucosa]
MPEANLDEIEQMIIELLAADLGTDPDELRQELVGRGRDMPFDSILLVELLAQVEDKYKVRLEATEETARAMRSIHGFARRILDEIQAAGSN